MYRILVVDDELEIIELLSIYLKNFDYEIIRAHNGKEAMDIFDKEDIQMALIDIMMPYVDGLQLLTYIRKTSNMPVIILSAKTEDMDKINALGLGADDYIAKPFNPLEVIARIQALFRRANPVIVEKSTIVKVQNITILLDSCEVFKENVSIPLTSKEFNLLLFLMNHPKKVFTKQQLYEAVWDDEYMFDDNTIMVYISKLREKLGDNPKEPKYIKNIRGLGYFFERD